MESVSRMPHLARMDVSPANGAEPNANSIHMTRHAPSVRYPAYRLYPAAAGNARCARTNQPLMGTEGDNCFRQMTLTKVETPFPSRRRAAGEGRRNCSASYVQVMYKSCTSKLCTFLYAFPLAFCSIVWHNGGIRAMRRKFVPLRCARESAGT